MNNDAIPTASSAGPDEALNDISKAWWQSKTIQAAIVAMLPPATRLLGFDDADIAPYAGDIVTIIAALLAILGRRSAVTVIR